MSRPVVTMVVVSWNVRDSLRRCLKSAMRSEGIEPRIVVVDNASGDGSADMVRREFPHIRLIANTTNNGFAAAVNQALTGSAGDVLLLNPDVELEPSTVWRMQQWLHADERIGIVGPRLLYPDGRWQPSVKRFPRWRDLFWTLSKLPNIFPGLVAWYQCVNFQPDRNQTVDQVMGSCFLIRRETLNQVGAFDEGFWIWFEEVDFSRRAKAAGWRSFYAANAQAVHGRGRSFVQLPAGRKQKLLRQSIRHYVRKHFGRLADRGLWPVLVVSWMAGMAIDLLHLRKPERAEDL